MPVELSIVESVTELETTVVEVVLDSSSAPGVAGPGVPAGGTTGQLLAKDTDTDYDTEWVDAGAPGAHATTHQDGGADEISLTGLSGTPAALTTHEADTTSVHGIADTSALALTANHPSNATFNDHSARHENGGADEISLEGLDGTPSELQDHLDDTAGAHAATAVSFTPAGTIAATTVQAAIEEVASEAGGGTVAAEDVTVDSTNLSGTGTDAQAVLEELDNLLDDHSARHENGGADEVSVEGLSGLLADGQTPLAHNHAGEEITSGTVADARIASTIARDSEVTTAVSDHSADTTSVHGISDTSALALTANHPSNATFNDHSARHEDGGADEITIAGLAGIPTELQTHLDDAADAHNASAISVLDTNGDYTATDVEGVLAEIAPQLGGVSGTPLDGWVDDTANTWTRTADQTFTVSGDRTVVFSKGTRLKWTQTTVKYGVVVNSSHAAGTTTVTIATTTDYVLTAAAISLNHYSYMANPQGYPTWFNYTPALTASSVNPNTGTNPAFTGRFEITGMRATVFAKVTFGTGGSVAAGTGTYRISLPFTVAATQMSIMGGLGTFEDASLGDEYAFTAYGIANQAYAQLYEAQTITTGFLTEANPIAPAASDVIALTIVVEI